jgi:hypothetical protein
MEDVNGEGIVRTGDKDDRSMYCGLYGYSRVDY